MKKKSPVVRAVKKVLPAVVNISALKYLDFFEISPFSKRKRGIISKISRREKTKTGGGSGFIVEASGIILTNRHVIEDVTADYVVVLQSGEKFKPEILAVDPINDVAVLKINPPSSVRLPIVELGDSSRLELGETVIAIGNALGLFANTVSCGIVSGLSREITAQSDISKETTKLRGLIQTDAAINPGNSGGPLVNEEGRAVGINIATVFGAENISFALPINSAKRDLEELRKYGRIRRPFLGFRYILIDRSLKERFNLPVDFGALIIAEPDILSGEKEAVVKGSPADKAGLREGDIVLEIDGQKVCLENTVSDILQDIEIGARLSLKVLRGKTQKKLNIILGERGF